MKDDMDLVRKLFDLRRSPHRQTAPSHPATIGRKAAIRALKRLAYGR